MLKPSVRKSPRDGYWTVYDVFGQPQGGYANWGYAIQNAILFHQVMFPEPSPC